ncbi:hypothetical protein B7486_75250, partial [cyanobacterium TDX16]
GAADVVVPVVDGRRQVLCARYRTAVAPEAQALLGAGEQSMRALLDRVTVDEVPEVEWRAVDPDGRSFVDLDTEDDLRRLRTLLGAEGQPSSGNNESSPPAGTGP